MEAPRGRVAAPWSTHPATGTLRGPDVAPATSQGGDTMWIPPWRGGGHPLQGPQGHAVGGSRGHGAPWGGRGGAGGLIPQETPRVAPQNQGV